MTVTHGFIDESVRADGWYRLTVVEVSAHDLGSVTRALRSMLPDDRQRLHFSSEGDARRRQILTAMMRPPIVATTVGAPYRRGRDEEPARQRCLIELLAVINPSVAVLVLGRLAIPAPGDSDHHDPQLHRQCASREHSLLIVVRRRCRDVTHALAAHPLAKDLTGAIIELDPELAARATIRIAETDVRLQVVVGDAGAADEFWHGVQRICCSWSESSATSPTATSSGRFAAFPGCARWTRSSSGPATAEIRNSLLRFRDGARTRAAKPPRSNRQDLAAVPSEAVGSTAPIQRQLSRPHSADSETISGDTTPEPMPILLDTGE